MTDKTYNANELTVAEALGKQAFADGRRCVPVHDPKLMDMIVAGGRETNEYLLDSWLTGWHRANLDAPVVG